jgi:2-dehydropantoate 2-reductase
MDGRLSDRAQAFLEACERAVIQAEISSTMLRALWEKYALIAAQAGMTALTRCPAGVVRSVPETRRMYRAIVGEMIALGNAVGAGLDAALADRTMAMLDGMGAAFTSSLHHDLAEGKRLELEALHGHAVRLGERHGIPTPMLFAVYAVLKPYADGPPQAVTP